MSNRCKSQLAYSCYAFTCVRFLNAIATPTVKLNATVCRPERADDRSAWRRENFAGAPDCGF